jgi:hypothetical protein
MAAAVDVAGVNAETDIVYRKMQKICVCAVKK